MKEIKSSSCFRPDLESLTDRNGEAEPPKCSMRNLWEITDGAFSALSVFFNSSLIVWAVCAFTVSPLVHFFMTRFITHSLPRTDTHSRYDMLNMWDLRNANTGQEIC